MLRGLVACRSRCRDLLSRDQSRTRVSVVSRDQRWTRSEGLQIACRFRAAGFTFGTQNSAAGDDGVAVGAEVGFSIKHQAVTDAGANGEVDEVVIRHAGTKARLGHRRRASVRFNARRRDRRESPPRRKITPFDQSVAGDFAFDIHQLGDSNADTAYPQAALLSLAL